MTFPREDFHVALLIDARIDSANRAAKTERPRRRPNQFVTNDARGNVGSEVVGVGVLRAEKWIGAFGRPRVVEDVAGSHVFHERDRGEHPVVDAIVCVVFLFDDANRRPIELVDRFVAADHGDVVNDQPLVRRIEIEGNFRRILHRRRREYFAHVTVVIDRPFSVLMIGEDRIDAAADFARRRGDIRVDRQRLHPRRRGTNGVATLGERESRKDEGEDCQRFAHGRGTAFACAFIPTVRAS